VETFASLSLAPPAEEPYLFRSSSDLITTIRVGSQPLWLKGTFKGRVPGIPPLGEGDGDVRFSVDPGSWAFEARCNESFGIKCLSR
jgi:hypothetical protein